MHMDAFTSVFREQISLCEQVLLTKAKEYSTLEDKLHNFKRSAALKGITPAQALDGFMLKHITSIYDMTASGPTTLFPRAKWEEKITDTINYLILLRAIVEEEAVNDESA